MSLAALLKVTSSWDEEDEREEVAHATSPRSAAAPTGALAMLLEATGADDEHERAKAPGTLEGIANTARRGIRSAGQSIDAASAAAAASLAADAAQEPERIAEMRRADPPPRRENFARYGDRADEVYTISLQKWQMREAEREERLRNNARFVDDQRREGIPGLISAVGRRQQEIDALPRSEAMQTWDEAEGAGEALRALASNPIEVLTNLAVEGATSGAPALAAGAIGSTAGPAGTVAGAGLGSFVTEYGGKIVAELQEMGVDFTKPETVAAVLNDPAQLEALRSKALRRGVPIAVLDAISAGLAGKLVTKPGQTIARKLLSGAQEIATQASLGAGGEVIGSVAAGDPIDAKSVLAEALGEVGAGSVEIATGASRRAATRDPVATAANDTGANVPESPDTLAAQQQQLLDGLRPAQMFPLGTDELPLPEGMERIETPRGVFHFNPDAITAEEIHAASEEGRENDVLALGPNSKADVDARARETGEPVITLTERDTAGREVKSAVTTPSLAPETAAELESTKTPGNTVQPEPVARVIADRTNAPGGALKRILRDTDESRPRGTAPTLTDAEADLELAAIRKAFPDLTREYDIEIGLVEDALRKRGYNGPVPEQVQAAVLRTKAQRSLIVLGARSYRDRQKGAALLTHEIAHPFWDTLPEKTKAELRALHVLEVENKTGPLYENSRLRSELDFVESMDENGAREWFAERIARLNEDWAKGRIDRAELSLLRKLAAELREHLQRIWATMARREGISPEDQLFVEQFRRFFVAGADAEVGRRAGEAFAQKLAAPRVPVTPAASPAFATAQTNSDAFRRWFGSSKVIDGAGKPLVVFRGEPRAYGKLRDDGAIFLTDDPSNAAEYAGQDAGANTIAAYVSLQNPLVIDAKGGSWNPTVSQAIARARSAGNDGVIVRNVVDNVSDATPRQSTTYIAFSPNQVKSAIGNRGTFDPTDARIEFATQKQPATKAELLTALRRARDLRAKAFAADDIDGARAAVEAVKAARDELDERFPGWEKAEAKRSPDAPKNPKAAAAHLRNARQRLIDRPDSAFRTDISEPVAQDLDILADLRDYAELTRRETEDFVAFGERMRADLGDRIAAYLPDAWDAVSGGRPLRDLYISDNPLKVDEGWKRAVTYGRLFWEGAADVLRRNKFTALADAVDRHIDLGDRNFANAWAIIGPAISKFQGITGLARRPRAKRVLREWSAYFAAREGGDPAEAKRILDAAHPDTKALIDATRRLFEFTGYHNERLGVMVYDPKIQGIRRGGNLGADYFPRMLRDEINAVLRDPSTNPALWEEMKTQLQENGNIQHTDDAGLFLKNNIPRETTDDFFSNLEMARSARLPDAWYETDFLKVIPRFVTSWAERSAQIEAFGQKIGDEGKDAFDRAIESTRNEAAQRYIEATREHAYRVSRLDPSTRKIVGNITSATSALFLGNPYSTLRNLVGGTAQAVNQFGGIRAIRALREARSAITDAQAAGALKGDVADLLFQGDASGPVREFTNVALKLGGFNAAEQVVRATNFLMARTFLRDSFAHFRRDPGSRASLQAAALMQRYGFDPQALLAENLKGPETDRFVRAAVREAQGGYRYNQVPLFLNSPAGRFVAQFARWGTMAARFHVRNVIAPAIIGERVRVRVGDQVTEKRVRTLLPLIRSPFVAMAAGALTYAAREALFGSDRVDPTWDEVFKTYDEDEQRGIDLALSRMAADVIMGGSFGAITDYAGMLKEAATRGRYKNPIEPPAASILKELGVLAYKRAQQGRLTADDYHQFASRVLTAYRYGRAAFYNFGEALGLDTAEARLFRADLDKRFTRAAGNRFAEEMGFDIPAFNSGGLPSVNENTPFYSSMEDALLSGDTYEAAQLLRRELAPLAGKKRTARLAAIKTSILGRQPLKAGGRSAEEMQREFIGWARRRLSPGEQQRMFEIQRRYLDTALRAGLLTPEEHARRTQYLPRVSAL